MTERRRVTEDGREPARRTPEAPMAPGEPIHTKYRPRRLKDVLGQDAAVRSLSAALRAKSRPHAFLFTGPPGTGKTTLARIVASEVGCEPANLVEIDAASNSGIDDMRGVTGALRYSGFGESPNKMIVVDECHGLSKQAWDSLLKSVEEPPAHVYFAFCSTNPGKIPAAIVTRCAAYSLGLVKRDDILDLLEDVSEREGFNTPAWMLDMVAEAAEGSPRQALTMLATVHDCEKDSEVAALLAHPMENREVIELCRMLVGRKLTWGKLTETLKGLGDMPAETVRILVVNYLNACLMGARSERDAQDLLDMLEPMLKPCNPSDKHGPLLAAFGRILFG